MLDTSENYLTPEEEQTLLAIARAAITELVTNDRRVNLDQFLLTPVLEEKHGAFVTLRRHGELRGCVGYTDNHVSLAEAVLDNAVNAASRDYRFEPATAAELGELTIEVSALTPGDTPETPFKKVNDVSEIVIGRDGLYIERPPSGGGILLPQVAVDQGWDVAQFLTAVCYKAGYADRSWEQPGTRLYRFSAQVFAEAPRPE